MVKNLRQYPLEALNVAKTSSTHEPKVSFSETHKKPLQALSPCKGYFSQRELTVELSTFKEGLLITRQQRPRQKL
jgi:hypothetical protein